MEDSICLHGEKNGCTLKDILDVDRGEVLNVNNLGNFRMHGEQTVLCEISASFLFYFWVY